MYNTIYKYYSYYSLLILLYNLCTRDSIYLSFNRKRQEVFLINHMIPVLVPCRGIDIEMIIVIICLEEALTFKWLLLLFALKRRRIWVLVDGAFDHKDLPIPKWDFILLHRRMHLCAHPITLDAYSLG